MICVMAEIFYINTAAGEEEEEVKEDERKLPSVPVPKNAPWQTVI